MNLSFDGGAATSTVVAQLAGNAIHDVTFKGVEAKTIESKDGDKYDILSIKFAGENGAIFEDSIFEPKAGDDQRKKNNFGYENPSNVEEMMFKVKHLLAAVAPKVAEKIEKAGGMDVGSWSALRDFVVKYTAEAAKNGAKTQIKLISRTDSKGVTRAHFPSFVLGINKDNKAYPKTNFIGATLAFTAKEQAKIDEAATAKPNNPDRFTADSSDLGGATPKAASAKLDLDFDLETA
jgi:hypothetical protein